MQENKGQTWAFEKLHSLALALGSWLIVVHTRDKHVKNGLEQDIVSMEPLGKGKNYSGIKTSISR